MMLSIANRAGLCCAAMALSGCMQSMPSAEVITKPTREAFVRLTSWTPWQPRTESAPVVLHSEEPAAPEPAVAAAVPAVAPLPPPDRPSRAVVRSEAGSARTVQRAPAVRRPVAIVPVVQAGSAAPAAGTLPGKLSCQTDTSAGARVRMQCTPID